MSVTTHKKIWARKNLSQFYDFLEGYFGEDMNLETLSQVFETTPQYVSFMFIKDNCRLSRIESVANKLGYNLVLQYPERDFNVGLLPDENLKRKNYDNAGNLAGLYKYICDSNLTVAALSKRINHQAIVLYKALKEGDIKISLLNEYLSELNIYVIWQFNKIEK